MRGRSGFSASNNVGAAAGREFAAIGETRGLGGRGRYQIPGRRQRQDPVGGQAEPREQLRRIVVVGGENRAQAFGDHVAGFGPTGMAAAAHHVGRAEHDEVSAPGRLARGFFIDRKFRDADAQRAKCPPHFRRVVVMRQHADAAVADRFGKARN